MVTGHVHMPTPCQLSWMRGLPAQQEVPSTLDRTVEGRRRTGPPQHACWLGASGSFYLGPHAPRSALGISWFMKLFIF